MVCLSNLPPPSAALLLHYVGLMLISQLSLRVGCHTDLWLQICSSLKVEKQCFWGFHFQNAHLSHYGPQTLHYSLVWVKILFAHVYYDKSSFWLVAWSNLIRASPPPPHIRASGLALQQQAAPDGQLNMKGTPPLHRWVCSIPWHILLPCIFLAGGCKCTCQSFND